MAVSNLALQLMVKGKLELHDEEGTNWKFAYKGTTVMLWRDGQLVGQSQIGATLILPSHIQECIEKLVGRLEIVTLKSLFHITDERMEYWKRQ